MPIRLKAPLAYPVILSGLPRRTLETFLDAVTYLHERQQVANSPEVEAAIDELLMAASKQDPADTRRVTAEVARLVEKPHLPSI